MNSKNLERLVTEARARKMDGASFLDWIAGNRIKVKIGGRLRPFSLDGHAYMRKLYTGIESEVAFRKGAQVTWSTWAILEALWIADSGSTAFYAFPRATDVQDFSHERISPLLQDSDLPPRLLIDNVGLRTFSNGGSVYLRGIEGNGQHDLTKVKSVAADAVYADESSEMSDLKKEFLQDRLLHSNRKWWREGSQAKFPDMGIDEAFAKSTQQFWHVKCPCCGEWQSPDVNIFWQDGKPWTKNFLPVPQSRKNQFADGQKWYRGCVKCGAALDMQRGEWIAAHPGKKLAGYHISQLITENTPPEEYASFEDFIIHKLQESRKPSTLQRLTNSIFAVGYSDVRCQPITDDVLDAATCDEGLLTDGVNAYLGADQGDMKWVVILEDRGRYLQIIHVASTEDWGDLHDMLAQYDVVFSVVDAMPNKTSAKDFAASYPGMVAIQYFTGKTYDFDKKERYVNRDNPGVTEVQAFNVNRDESLDDTVELLLRGREGGIVLPKRGPKIVETLRAHLKMAVREYDESGDYHFLKNCENHLLMALNSARIAFESNGGGTWSGAH